MDLPSLKFKILSATLLLLLTQHAVAEESISDGSENLDELLNLLQEQTAVATKTKMNADFVPGLVTILYGDELEAKGARTVWEALAMVPGLEPSFDQSGGRQILVRGAGGTFASGNLKVLLNDTPMNSTLAASPNPVLNMPVEQVERIEVIRGPGAAIHGEFAFAGVVRVVTRSEKRKIFGRGESFATYMGGGVYQWQSDNKETRASINAAGWQSDGANVFVPSDVLFHQTTPWIPPAYYRGLSNAPGRSQEEMYDRSLILSLQHKNLFFSATWVEDGYDDHFGTLQVIPPDNHNAVAYKDQFLTLEGRGEFNLDSNTDLHVTLGRQNYTNYINFPLLPAGFIPWYTANDILTNNFVPGRLMPNGYLVSGRYGETRYSGNIDLFYKGLENHKMLLGLGVSHIEVGDSWQSTNVAPRTKEITPNIIKYTHDDGLSWPDSGTSRQIESLLFQDEYQAAKSITLTGGARYDHFSDVGGNLSPRMAAVWRITDNHLIKAQYAQAFRPPTFYEMAWTPKIRPETIQTRELSYIYKGSKTQGKATLFSSNLKDHIVQNGILGFTNGTGAHLMGVELELNHRLNDQLKIEANVTLESAEDSETHTALPGAADRLANLGMTYQPTSDYSFNLWLRHVGERSRESNDPRSNLQGYQTVDLTGNVHNLYTKGMTLRGGVKNVFDEDVRYPARMTFDAIGQSVVAYSQDYPRPGRTLWMSLSQTF